MSEALKLGDFVHAIPIFVVAAWACLVLFASAAGIGRSFRLGPIAALGALIGIAACVWSWGEHASAASELFSGMLVIDRFGLFLDVLFLIGATLTCLLAHAYLDEHEFSEGEFYATLLLAVAGMMIMVHAADFVTMVIGLETMSLGVYSLVACWTEKRKSAEAGLKYFVMGAVASAILLYGVALLYGVTGSTNYAAIVAKGGAATGDPLFIVGMLMIVGGLAFKVALVPFHMWTPDAYEGAPTPVTGFMAAAVKAAGFGVLVRICQGVFGAEQFAYGSTGWINIFWTLSAVSMTVGNLLALRQNNVKRMLAYSSISHAGYLMVGVLAIAVLPRDPAPLLFYLLQYGITTVGAFGIVAWIGSRDAERVGLEDWAGLSNKHPAAAATMTLFLLSLGGIPPTSGFFAKLYIFRAALDHPQLLTLVLIAAANSVISIFYYLKPVVAMYFREPPPRAFAAPIRSGAMTTALAIAALLVLLLGMMPGSPLEWAGLSVMAGR